MGNSTTYEGRINISLEKQTFFLNEEVKGLVCGQIKKPAYLHFEMICHETAYWKDGFRTIKHESRHLEKTQNLAIESGNFSLPICHLLDKNQSTSLFLREGNHQVEIQYQIIAEINDMQKSRNSNLKMSSIFFVMAPHAQKPINQLCKSLSIPCQRYICVRVKESFIRFSYTLDSIVLSVNELINLEVLIDNQAGETNLEIIIQLQANVSLVNTIDELNILLAKNTPIRVAIGAQMHQVFKFPIEQQYRMFTTQQSTKTPGLEFTYYIEVLIKHQGWFTSDSYIERIPIVII